jgi:predicted anti-sigma-YlaC factor YlaD
MIAMSKWNCAQVRRALSEARPDDWSADARAAVEEHLASCDPCRKDAAVSRLVRRSLAQRRASTHAPEGFASSVMSRVASREAVRKRRWSLVFDLRALRPVLAVATVLVLALTFTAVYVHHGVSTSSVAQVNDGSQSFVDQLVLTHQDLASMDTGADAGILLTRYSPSTP